MKPHRWKLRKSQAEWLKWLMEDNSPWLWDHIGGRDGGGLKWNRLEEILQSGEYSHPDREFLNWLRERWILQGGMNVYKRSLKVGMRI